MSLSPSNSGFSASLPARRAALPHDATPLLAWLLVPVLVAAGVAVSIYPSALAALLGMALLVFWASRTFRDPLAGIVGAFCFYPVCSLLLAAHSAYGLPTWTSGTRLVPDLALILVFLALIVRASKQNKPFRIYSDDLPVLTYILAGAYSFVVAASYLFIFGPLNGWWVSITPAMFYFAIRFLRPTAEQLERFSRFFLGTFVALAVPSFYQYIVRPDWIINLSQAMRGYVAISCHLSPYVYWRIYTRMESLLFEENVWGTLCAFVLLYCLAGLKGRKTPLVQIVAAFLSVGGMILSQSRGSWVTFLVGISVLLTMRGHHRGRIAGTLALVALVGGFVMMRWGSASNDLVGSVQWRINSLTNTDTKTNVSSDRSFQWRIGWDIFKHNPSGTGLGTVGVAAHMSGVGQHQVADGIYFRILAEQGVPGALMILYALAGTGWVLWRHVFDYSCSPSTRRLGLTLFAFHCGFVIQSLGANTYDFWYVPTLFWTFFGFFVARCHAEQAEAATRAAALRSSALLLSDS